MEFPGMAHNRALTGKGLEKAFGKIVDDMAANLELTAHEMCHMYFPFLMGINEKKYAWMEEGMAQFSGYFLKDKLVFHFDRAKLGNQQITPIMVPTFTQPSNHGSNSYLVSSLSYYALSHLLGPDQFKKSLNVYMDTWKYKHPTPYDFMFSFNTSSGLDLNWFWKRWYFDWGHVDIGIKNFKGNRLTLENPGGRPMAFEIQYTYADGTTSSEMVSPIVWKDASSFTKKVTSAKPVVSIELKVPYNFDAVPENNIWKSKTVALKTAAEIRPQGVN
jgi:aminopeptidase N